MFKKRGFYLFPFLIFCVFYIGISLFSNTIKSQNHTNFIDVNPILIDISELIPPMSSLIDSAITNASTIKERYTNMKIAELAIFSSKRTFYKFISFDGHYNYGTLDYYSIGNIGITNTQQITNRYTIGATLKIPIFELIERKNSIKSKQFEYEKNYYACETEKKSITKDIIYAYNDLILKQKIFKIANESALDAKIQSEMAELQFTKGEISISDFSTIKDIRSRSQMQLERSKIDFLNAYLILQEITGVRFKSLRFIE